MPYAYICRHPSRERWQCGCGDRRALMCIECAKLDHEVLDDIKCLVCGEAIEYREGATASPV